MTEETNSPINTEQDEINQVISFDQLMKETSDQKKDVSSEGTMHMKNDESIFSRNDDDKKRIVEALIFASEEPLSFKQIRSIIEEDKYTQQQKTKSLIGDDTKIENQENEDGQVNSGMILPSPKRGRRSAKSDLTPSELKKIINALNVEYDESGRTFRIVEIAEGFTFQTRKEFGSYVGKMFAEKAKRKLTHSALETLAIIAFRQPISKPAVEAVRGVNADFVLKSLLEKNLITIVGREETVGRPLLYGTTETFLKHFGLANLDDLPKPREIQELLAEEESIGIESIEENDSREFEIDSTNHLIDSKIFNTIPVEITPADEDEYFGSSSNDVKKQSADKQSNNPPLQIVPLEFGTDVSKLESENPVTESSSPDTDEDDFEDDE